ncbi:hypothetical protein GGR77_001894 [Xanthomonas translucens]
MTHRYSRYTLCLALSRTLNHPITEEACIKALSGLASAYFPVLDQQLRHYWWHDAYNGEPDNISTSSETALFMAACDRSGFRREQALRDFGARPGRLAVAAALLRCDDWVPQVQAQAIALLRSIVTENSGSLFDFIDLLLILRERERFSEQAWNRLIVPLMQQPSNVDHCWAATVKGSPRARLFAYQLLVRTAPNTTEAASLQAIDDLAPSVAAWGLSMAAHLPSAGKVLAAIKRASRHPLASIRAQALRLHVEHDAADAHAVVAAALFSATHSLRNAAIHLSGTRYGEAPLLRYRAAIDTEEPVNAEVAVIALADLATAEDANRLRPWMQAHRAVLRISALSGLARAKPEDLRSLVSSALMDSSPKVVRQAVAIAKREIGLSREMLHDAYSQVTAAPIKHTLIRATHELDKWNALALLLLWHQQADDATAETLELELNRWVRDETRRFTPLGDALRNEIHQALKQQRSGDTEIHWSHIEFALNSS